MPVCTRPANINPMLCGAMLAEVTIANLSAAYLFLCRWLK
ncbi:hypothetical protein ALT1000_70176 [Alteromonas macleodii]